MRCVFAYVNANSMACDWGGGWRRRSRGIEVEKGGDEFPAIVQRCRPDESSLKLHAGFTEQPRLTLQTRRRTPSRSPSVDRAADLLHDETPSTVRPLVACARSEFSMKYLMKAGRPDASVDVLCRARDRARCDRSSRSDATASCSKRQARRERFIDGREIVPVLIERGANGVEVAERRKELQRARKQAFALKQLAAALWRGTRGGPRTPMASRPRRRRSAALRTPRG